MIFGLGIGHIGILIDIQAEIKLYTRAPNNFNKCSFQER
uniref:Uncharacterized protein n=1 Tax=Anguilla anguilla TaxID=7936 RepID=A0A0E9SJI9_ANGAN